MNCVNIVFAANAFRLGQRRRDATPRL